MLCLFGLCHVSFFVFRWFWSFSCCCSVSPCCWFRFVWWLLFLVGSFFSALIHWCCPVVLLFFPLLRCFLRPGCLAVGRFCRVRSSCLVFLGWSLLVGFGSYCSLVRLWLLSSSHFFYKVDFILRRRFRDRYEDFAIANVKKTVKL